MFNYLGTTIYPVYYLHRQISGSCFDYAYSHQIILVRGLKNTKTTINAHNQSKVPISVFYVAEVRKVIVVAYDNAGNKSEEITKEFTISPTPTPIPTPSPLGEVLGESDEELIGTTPSPSPTPSIIIPLDGEVQGESTEKTRSWNKWILAIIALGGIGLFAQQKRRKY